MSNLNTRKIVLGLLMTLVLAFSVQGIADALTLSKTRGDFQTKPAGSTFDITFSVRLDSNSTKRYNSNGQQIDEHGNEIDSSGYLIAYIRGSARRLISSSALSDANNVADAVTYNVTSLPVTGTLRVRGPNDRSSTGFHEDQYSLNHSGNLYLSGTSVVDSQDSAVYVEESRQRDVDGSTITEYQYTRARATPVAAYSSNAPQRYAYNDEQIMITSTGTTGIQLLDSGGRRYNVAPPNNVLNERDQNLGIPSSITLKIETDATTAATHTVVIADSRANGRMDDYPVPKPVVDPITFTLYTTTGTGDPDASTTITVAPSDRSQSTARTTLQIDRLYTDPEATALLVYQVLSGPGTLYLGEYDEPSGTPTTSLITAKATDVFLYLNGGDSIVRVYVDGADPDDDGARISFSYTGTDRSSQGQQQQQQQQQQQTTGSLNITVSGTGATRSVTVNAVSAAGTPTAIPAVLTGTATSTQTIITGTATAITLPTAPGSYTLTATASVAGYNPDTETITVAGPTSLGTISISQIGTPTNGVQTFSITVRRTDGTTPAPLTVTVSGTGFTSSSVPTANGSGAVNITLPTTAGLYTLTARATGYTSGPTTVRIAGTGQQQQQQQPAQQQPAQQQPTVSEPDSVSIVGPSQRDGTVNEELGAALVVEVVDDDGEAVEDARVIFRVRSGQGRLSQGGRGRAIAVQTDSRGHARANYTPTGGGTHTVEAEVRGVTRTVEFTITTGSAPPPRDLGTREEPSPTVSPVVHVVAASRPPMLWVDGGAIYGLVGADAQRFAPSVDNALNIAVGGGKVYWTEKTGENSGTINSANLNGSDVTELTPIKAVPMGIAVDAAGSKLYWTNSRGRIQSANLDGSGITNVIPGGLESPMDLALAGGNGYWTQGNGSVRVGNLTSRVTRDISTGTDTPGSIVIGGNKVYWTEMTGDSSGTINSANLNGTDVKELTSIRAVPMGIAVDGSRSKLYWTNSRGRVQSANLDGSGITNVVSGLGSPAELVLSNSITAPAAAPAGTASGSKYDVNGDGTVDTKDSDALIIAVAAKITDAKYDVNGDGTVDINDVVAVSANRDAGAAGAPTLVGMKLSAVQIDRLQEQIDLLIATNDRSPAALRTLIYLQQLIVTARPEKTQLLANYPNPFNPETWIPYELATDTNVKVTIYNTQGVVIRTLQLGHQSAGYYVGRDRAAYWDGRNALGEQVASGLYFYQLETDEMSLMRKMVILK